MNPASGFFINDTFNPEEDININKPKNTDNTFKLKTEIQKKPNDIVLDTNKPPLLPHYLHNHCLIKIWKKMIFYRLLTMMNLYRQFHLNN